MKKLLILLASVLFLFNCSSDDGGTTPPPDNTNNPTPTPTPTPTPEANAVRLRTDGTFGNMLTDADGMSLYFFSPDATGDSNCTDGCLNNWPVFYESDLTLDDGLDADDFGSITRSDGDMQTTYKGWPLYFYASDSAEGDVNGDGVNAVWFVAKPDYSVMMAQAQLVGRDRDGNETNLTVDYEAGDGATFYMTDAWGNTLYGFINDSNGVNNFTKEDFSNDGVWPILELALDQLPSILDTADFGSIDVFGRQQLTYKGWPLYYFVQDEARGDNYGVGFPAPGVWPIVNPDTEVAPQPEGNAVRLRVDGTFGNMLTDSEGMSLYFFSPDATGDSNCTDGCLNNWPVFYEADPTLDEGLDADDFGAITRSDGDMQTTYKGWPLYYYASDNAEGDVNGDGVGSVWFVAKTDYSVMMARAQLVGRDPDGVETNLTSDYGPGDGNTFYMTDAAGNTLYGFVNDTNGVNNYTNEDFSNDALWPIFEEELESVPSVLDAADFGSIEVFGRQQLTYKGWPIYYFGPDEARGDNYGVGFPAPGVWPILNPDTETAPEAEVESVAYTVTNNGAQSYSFNGDGLSDAVNPDLTLTRGETYEFDVTAPGHPFLIKSVQSTGTGDTYTNGVDNNGASEGKVTFTVPMEAPDTLYYICEFHSPMTGTLNIVD